MANRDLCKTRNAIGCRGTVRANFVPLSPVGEELRERCPQGRVRGDAERRLKGKASILACHLQGVSCVPLCTNHSSNPQTSNVFREYAGVAVFAVELDL
jgi:hypothetical protein